MSLLPCASELPSQTEVDESRLRRCACGQLVPTPQRASTAWIRVEAAEKLLERLKAILKEYARQQPFETVNGYIVEEIDETKEEIVATRAKAALERYLGEQLGGVVFSQSVETKTKLTKSALKSNLTKYILPTLPKEKQKITHVERDTLEALREAGAVSVTSYKHVKEHKAEKKEEPKKLLAQASAEKTNAEKWDGMTPDGRLEYGLGKPIDQAVNDDEARKKARDEKIRACELSEKGHKFSRMGRCFECNAPKPPEARP